MSPAVCIGNVRLSTILFSFSLSWRSGRSISEADRSSLSEPDAAEEEEAEDQLHEAADRRAGEAFSQTKVLGIRRASGVGQVAEDDGRAGENLVPKQTDEMEVSRGDIW